MQKKKLPFYYRRRKTETSQVDPGGDEKRSQYLIERFRSLGSSTTRWGLIFFAALLYTWYISIQPKSSFIAQYVTAKKKYVFFDSLSARANKQRAHFIKGIDDTIRRLTDSLTTKGIHPNRKVEIKTALEKINERLTRTPERKWKLKQLLIRTINEKEDYAKDSLVEEIKKNFYPGDVLVARAEIQKSDVKKYKDSLVEKSNIVFQIPGLTSINLGFRVGLIFWMLLSIILLLYLFGVRLKMIQYLKEIYHLKGKELKEKSKGFLDLQVPFWFCPIAFKRSEERDNFKKLIGWKFSFIQNIVLIVFLLMVLLLQINVGWISWHMNVEAYFDDNIVLRVLTIALLSVSFLVVLLWFQPVSFSNNFTSDEHFSFKRREFVKLGVAATVFLVLIPAVGKSLPLIKGAAINYKRVRRRKKQLPKSKLADGFYIHNTAFNTVVHYYAGGYSSAYKTMNEKQQAALEKKLVKIPTEKLMGTKLSQKLHIVSWQHCLEEEAQKLRYSGNYSMAAEVFLFALNYSFLFADTNKIMITRRRLRNRLLNILKYERSHLNKEDVTRLEKAAKEVVGKIKLIERTKMKVENTNKGSGPAVVNSEIKA